MCLPAQLVYHDYVYRQELINVNRLLYVCGWACRPFDDDDDGQFVPDLSVSYQLGKPDWANMMISLFGARAIAPNKHREGPSSSRLRINRYCSSCSPWGGVP